MVCFMRSYISSVTWSYERPGFFLAPTVSTVAVFFGTLICSVGFWLCVPPLARPNHFIFPLKSNRARST